MPAARTRDVDPPLRDGASERRAQVEALECLARPVLEAMAEGALGRRLPRHGDASRAVYAPLEAFGRVLAGIAPWLAVAAEGEEERLRRELAGLARRGLALGVDPASPGRLHFADGGGRPVVDWSQGWDQPLVDASLLALALLRAPGELLEPLAPEVRGRLLDDLRRTRVMRPYWNNHLLFAAAVEAFLCRIGEDYDPARIDAALRQHEQGYLGDGVYADGPELHCDYYNGYVIHPYLLEIVRAVADASPLWARLRQPLLARARRHATLMERLISPEGTFPPLGRSICYRFGAFHGLGLLALWGELPEGLAPAAVRSALGAVIHRSLEAPGTFDAEGWLTPGLCGHQPGLAEFYVNAGSPYYCCLGLVPLGLPAGDAYWSAPPASWTARRAWRGEAIPRDEALPAQGVPYVP